MKKIKFLIPIVLGVTLFSCQQSKEEVNNCDKKIVPTEDQMDFLGITNKDKLSAASKRALLWDEELVKGNDWFFSYETYDLKGDLAYEEGVVRRDPSAMIKHDGKYYVWYSKSVGPTDGFGGDIENDKVFPWDRCDIWYATSKDGLTWKEEGLAVARGEKGTYDDRSVFTVEIMENDGLYYLCYQTIGGLYNVRTKNQIGLAWSTSPNGPWTKSEEPILSPADNGIWKGEEQDRFAVIKKGDFDSHKVHDPCILPYKGKFYLYYKGEQMGEAITFGGRQIRHGVAIADNPKGPYVKSEYNPISNSGHEICVWPYNGGIASLITTDGPEKNTVQWSPDGINFDIKAVVKGAPHAIGLNRTADNEKEPTEILRWGLTHEYRTYNYQYIRGFKTARMIRHTAKGVVKGKEVKVGDQK
ncbi:glycosyl hydrolase [Wenyingzhuangia fucanilytica]|uniref:Glycosyl hydrolase n=1 Tax=Wenyingzhuangia fucanilytica TaxID=1790137 RepID=A0A1B1Y2U1_9FLAO|nr:family 43 glycosylhydrolase [Wenyingzhuangia fucanilytica]ANW95081.1 glycosyl hydrolase [Wenyingzhuangia fucanilytica]